MGQQIKQMRLFRPYLTIFLLMFLSCTERSKKSDSIIELSKKEQSFSNLELTSHVFLDCIINDSIKGEFLFDSGANGLVLDKSFLTRNHLEDRIINSSNSYTYGVGLNRTKHQSISNIHISIDDKTFKGLELRVMPLDSIFRKVLNHKIDGIVGYDIFDEYLMEMNFDRSTFKLIDSIDLNDRREYIQLNYASNYRKPIVKVSITKKDKEKIECNLIFDMGSGRGISLTKNKGIQENLFTAELDCEKDSIAGMGGISESCYLSVDSLKLAAIPIKLDTIEIGNDENGALGMHKMYDGLIGMRIIEKFNLVINPKDNVIWLQKRMPAHN